MMRAHYPICLGVIVFFKLEKRIVDEDLDNSKVIVLLPNRYLLKHIQEFFSLVLCKLRSDYIRLLFLMSEENSRNYFSSWVGNM